MTGFPWTEQRDAALKGLLDQGLSASRIAAALGDVSRNAVIGRLHRIGLAGGGVVRKPRLEPVPSAVPAPPPAPKPVPHPSAIDFSAPEPPQPKSRNIKFDKLSAKHCRWPHGTGPFLFCGQPRHGNRPYCTYHCRLAYTKPPQRKVTNRTYGLAAA